MDIKYVCDLCLQNTLIRALRWIITTVLSFIFKSAYYVYQTLIVDSLTGCKIIYGIGMDVRNENIKDICREYNVKYLFEGWTIITTFLKIGILIGWMILLIICPLDDPFIYRSSLVCPSILVVLVVLSESIKRSHFVQENCFFFSLIAYGFVCISGNSKKDSYYIFEFWFVYYCFACTSCIFMCLNWKKIVLAHIIVIFTYAIRMKVMFNGIPGQFWVSITMSSAVYTVSAILISKQIKDMLLIIQENKELIKTIRTILEVFPEGVLIRSCDPNTKKIILKFANDIAKKFIISNDEECDTNITIVNPHGDFSEPIDIKISEFLKKQENDIFDSQNNDKNILEQLIEIKSQLDDSDLNCESNEDSTCFTVKSIAVNWENNKSSVMHVFVNTSKIRKLERVKAESKCQQLMFACISHEFRTPLNAFMNSLQLIEINIEEIKYHLQNISCNKKDFSMCFNQFAKFIKIGKVSSKLLLNLIEDILDLAKFNSKKLSLNIEEFKIYEIIEEIDYIFSFQCKEKRLEFNIKCINFDKNSIVKSDSKRIKQILINLISNSLKFTLEGIINISIKKIIENNQNFIEFEVYDTGIGINKADIPKLFQMFSMLTDDNILLNKSGTGIGLSISKMLVEQLGGYIKVDSEIENWTKFTFIIKDHLNLDENIEESKVQPENTLIQRLQPFQEISNDVMCSQTVEYPSSFEEFSRFEFPTSTIQSFTSRYTTKEIKSLSNL